MARNVSATRYRETVVIVRVLLLYSGIQGNKDDPKNQQQTHKGMDRNLPSLRYLYPPKKVVHIPCDNDA
jgi:hypothetical protein